MIGLFILVYLIISTALGLFILRCIIQEEQEARGGVIRREFLLMILICLVPILNWIVIWGFISESNYFSEEIFVKKA